LVGGTAKLPGMAEFVRDRLQLPARIGKLQPLAGLIDTVEDSAYCTAVGLMLLDILLPPDTAQMQGGQQGTGSMFGIVDNVLGYFKRR
jgi:cell division protein FtsA